MERVLVGVDGSTCSAHAMKWAADLARRAGFELVVARVRQPGEQRSMEELEDWLVSLAVGADRVRTMLLDGDPPDALLEACKSQHVDLLVVGSRGAGGFAHLHIGSVAHHLLYLTHLTRFPLAVVPPTAPITIHRLVVGNDGSPGSAAGIKLTAQLAQLLGVPVTAVYSFEPSAQMKPSADLGSWPSRVEAEVGSWITPIERAGVPVDVYIDPDRDVHPVAAMEYALKVRSGSVAVLGTRGLGGFSGLRLGHVPLQLVNHTHDAVILVPPAS
jgi:nucleotide-binding universal stress UspA family protein